MIKILAISVFGVLFALACLHVFWAFGGLWPAQSERQLIDTVIGDPDMAKMPSMTITLFIAICLFVSAFSAVWSGGVLSSASRFLPIMLAGGAGVVFFGRGVGGFFFERLAWSTVEPFTSLNKFVYSPLCILIGAALIILTLSRLAAD